mmetsp:Transcript_63180/g.168973  ORF Transcript_63180/g.168973 Transcript_63180/m.168973 type:complete len:166 (-) Transcript_63180:72-569(-)
MQRHRERLCTARMCDETARQLAAVSGAHHSGGGAGRFLIGPRGKESGWLLLSSGLVERPDMSACGLVESGSAVGSSADQYASRNAARRPGIAHPRTGSKAIRMSFPPWEKRGAERSMKSGLSVDQSIPFHRSSGMFGPYIGYEGDPCWFLFLRLLMCLSLAGGLT